MTYLCLIMRKRTALIILIYLVLGAIWLVMGAKWIERIDKLIPEKDLSWLYAYKNIFFLFISAILLFLLIEMYKTSISKVEKNYQQLFEGTPATIYVFDKITYQFLKVNKIMTQKYGYSEKELLEMTITDIRSDQEASKLNDYLRSDHLEGNETGVWLHRKKNGEFFHQLISHHSTVYKGKTAYMVIAIDVENHVKAEEKIKELLNTYETVTSVTNDVIWEYNPYNDTIKWMNGFSEVFGYTEDLRINSGEWVLNKIHPEDKNKVVSTVQQAFKELSSSWRCEYRFQCADGTYKEVSNQAFILVDHLGKTEKMVGALRDITIRKDYEMRLLHRNKMLREIAWNNSHEIRRPLSNILGLTDLLNVDPETSSAHAELLRMLGQSAIELDEIVIKINDSLKDANLED
ncbi:PAS domain S-box-containing protein [Pedobacter cryoconitis]|uniref:histidine kinase n=1 Tax=Pedobacter cryoconitis TaxID=188932 RepID=A0A7W8ZII4_9SPHI|nr:PAS domain S-box protein [Pedobacter cryoconitis]MBB5634601.1 PAS domain S-box-containing protein [Pedobacter cryoconitis]